MNQEKVGKNIVSIRKKYNLSQSAFASRIGVTSQAVSKWENGRGIPDIEIMLRIKEEFKVDIDEIITGVKNHDKQNKRFYIILSIVILSFLTISIVHLYSMKNNASYQLASISTSNDEFSIRGIYVQNKENSSIYISNIICSDKFLDKKKYIAIEGVLYQEFMDNQKIISSYGNIDDAIIDGQESKYLMDLLNEIEFKVDTLESSSNVSNYYLLLNALVFNGDVITYKIPLYVVYE